MIVSAAAPTVDAGYQRTYLEFESAPGVTVPAWLLIPVGLTSPAPAVIAVHGHGYGADDIVGIKADGTERTEPQGYHQDFAIALCRRGMVVIAPELRGFGRRREPQDQIGDPASSSCHALAWWAIMLGKPLLGSRVADTLRALDLLQSLPEGEMYDIAALIAPHPLMIVTGSEDPLFPLPGFLEAYGHLRGTYTALGAADRLDKDVFAGGHQINAAKAYDFLWRWLSEKDR